MKRFAALCLMVLSLVVLAGCGAKAPDTDKIRADEARENIRLVEKSKDEATLNDAGVLLITNQSGFVDAVISDKLMNGSDEDRTRGENLLVCYGGETAVRRMKDIADNAHFNAGLRTSARKVLLRMSGKTAEDAKALAREANDRSRAALTASEDSKKSADAAYGSAVKSAECAREARDSSERSAESAKKSSEASASAVKQAKEAREKLEEAQAELKKAEAELRRAIDDQRAAIGLAKQWEQKAAEDANYVRQIARSLGENFPTVRQWAEEAKESARQAKSERERAERARQEAEAARRAVEAARMRCIIAPVTMIQVFERPATVGCSPVVVTPAPRGVFGRR